MTLRTLRGPGGSAPAGAGPSAFPLIIGTMMTSDRPMNMARVFASSGCRPWIPTALVLLAAACDPRPAASPQDDPDPPADAPATVVDSIFPVEEEIRRFQAELPEEVEELTGGEASRDALVARFIASLEAADTTGLAGLAMTPGEFGYLYYPTSRYTRPPYRLSPSLVWFQNQNQSSRGLTRLLRRYAGHPMEYIDFHCPGEAEVEGQNRFWHYCTVRHLYQGDTVEVRLFGSIWEREGLYKLVGFANDL
jgi:hypothetical protein